MPGKSAKSFLETRLQYPSAYIALRKSFFSEGKSSRIRFSASWSGCMRPGGAPFINHCQLRHTNQKRFFHFGQRRLYFMTLNLSDTGRQQSRFYSFQLLFPSIYNHNDPIQHKPGSQSPRQNLCLHVNNCWKMGFHPRKQLQRPDQPKLTLPASFWAWKWVFLPGLMNRFPMARRRPSTP